MPGRNDLASAEIGASNKMYAVAVSEFLLNAAFDDVLATASRLLGRNMATYLDESSRDTLLQATSVVYGYNKYTLSSQTAISPYDLGTPAANRAALTGNHHYTTAVVKDITETLATKNVPRLGSNYISFIHPHQSRKLRDDPSWIEASKFAQPGAFQTGTVGMIDEMIFVETTQVKQTVHDPGSGTPKPVYQSISIGDNAFGHAISLPVELRDGGVLDFGREHALA
ncbi:N4-gp56 family major capsid protein [Streptosporangium sp. NPDC023825]|uniref:N4-gp56 family major capsid protein n=1 Tax=Streptosporangium sp. NPDC023825 TaxID=3154909 RepID=UPI003448E0B4